MTVPGSRCLVYIAGNRWDDVAGTDHQLVRALGRLIPVLWVDPPFSAIDRLRAGGTARAEPITEVADGVRRLQLLGPPGPSRFGLRRLARLATATAIRRVVRAERLDVAAVVVASAQASFPGLVGARRMLFATDDWVVGAPMMGLSRSAVAARLRANLRSVDVVAAVSPELAGALGDLDRPAQVLANGVTPVGLGDRPDLREPVAGLLGQLNERIDLDLLNAVADAGISIRVIGPVTARDPQAIALIERFLGRPEISWVGRVSPDRLRDELSRVQVGLTPYADNDFNRASFPLKTLEYLGAGLPVVATDLPSAHWLGCEDVAIARTAVEFTAAVRQWVDQPFQPAVAQARIAFADRHNWDARAQQLLTAVGAADQLRPAAFDDPIECAVIPIDSVRTRRR